MRREQCGQLEAHGFAEPGWEDRKHIAALGDGAHDVELLRMEIDYAKELFGCFDELGGGIFAVDESQPLQ